MIYERAKMGNDFKNALNALYQIQHEVEKDLANLNLTNYNINIYKDMSEEELESERLKSLERLKILKGEISKPKKELEIDASEIRETTKNDGDRGTQSESTLQGE